MPFDSSHLALSRRVLSQTKFVETTQKAKNLNMSIMQGEKDIRRAALTGAELSALPEDVGCCKVFGPQFREGAQIHQKERRDTVKASRAEIEQCTLQREHLKKTLAETETNIKELLTGNEALSRAPPKRVPVALSVARKLQSNKHFFGLFSHTRAPTECFSENVEQPFKDGRRAHDREVGSDLNGKTTVCRHAHLAPSPNRARIRTF